MENKKCKDCGNSIEYYAKGLCKKCYYRNYMGEYLKRNPDKLKIIRKTTKEWVKRNRKRYNKYHNEYYHKKIKGREKNE